MGWLRRRRADRAASGAPADHAGGAPPPTDDRTELMADVVAMAATFVAEHGDRPDLDGSLASLRVVDDLLGDLHTRGEELDEGDWWFASAYVMECARRAYGGEYLGGPSAADPIVLVVGRPDFEAALAAMSKVAGRVRNGPEDDLPFFVDGLASLVARRASGFVI